jgi:hypothetical protein
LNDPVSFGRKPHSPSALSRWIRIPPLDLTRPLSAFNLVGLSFLYASAYFLPLLMPVGSYLLPSYDYLGLVGWPSLVAIGVGIALFQSGATVARRWLGPRLATVLAVAALSIFTLIALKSIMYVVGYDWTDRMPHKGGLVAAQRIFKIIVALVTVVSVWSLRRRLSNVNRALASLGFGFLGLAAVRLIILLHGQTAIAALPGNGTGGALRPLTQNPIASDARPRRVVWVIFDETDFQRVFGPLRDPKLPLPNFESLARKSVFAAHANSPASATLYSVPALLTGTPISAAGIQINTYGMLMLHSTTGDWVPFDEATSVFGAVSAGGHGVSVLGFLHPYCKILATQRCESMAWPHVGALDDALWSNIPGLLSTKLGHPNTWEAITERIVGVLPEYLIRDDALTFVHVDLPHLPSTYAESVLHIKASADPLVNYAHNLLLADQVLGKIVATLEPESARHELLLVVSTDHWLRKVWYRPDKRESSSPVPLMMWRVGDTQGTVLAEPLSTVHTANMILSFLSGEITTQAEIAQWWSNKPVYPSFIAPNT